MLIWFTTSGWLPLADNAVNISNGMQLPVADIAMKICKKLPVTLVEKPVLESN
jgi:hypothetical protein